ncbi:MAG: DUF6273 domain-containing protein [Lachnospiraceae bacterium]|nr:DUF6273 domain-containing protein [Lachnospiraceae bacterium]
MGKVGTEATLLNILGAISEGNLYLKNIAQEQKFDLQNVVTMKNISDAGLARQYFKIGDQVIVTYESAAGTTYDMPWDVVHIGDALLADGTTKKDAIYLQSHYATLEAIQFDHEENEKATEETAQEGMYYYIPNPNGDGSFQLLTINTGDTIDYTANPNVYHSAIKDTTGNIVRYGYNRETHAALPQWLNSNADKGAWWTAKHTGDVAPNQLASVRGFLAGLPKDFVDCMSELTIKQFLNTVSEPDKTIGSETYTAKVFLPRLEQMYVNPQVVGEGEAWDYYKQLAQGAGLTDKFAQRGTYPILISYALENHTSAQVVRLASAYRGGSGGTWYVNSSGVVGSGGANGAYRCRPACVI